MNSEGLLLLTNDGGLKRQLELPTTGWQRRYRVRVHGDVDEAKLASLINGITIEGFDYGPIEASLERTLGKNAWLNVALREGKNREIRKVMEHFGWPVNRLIRVSFGPFHLGNLAKSAVDEIKTKVVKDQIGLVLQSTTPQSQRKRRLKTRSNTATAQRPLTKGETAKTELAKAGEPTPRDRKMLTLKSANSAKSTSRGTKGRKGDAVSSAQPKGGRRADRTASPSSRSTLRSGRKPKSR